MADAEAKRIVCCFWHNLRLKSLSNTIMNRWYGTEAILFNISSEHLASSSLGVSIWRLIRQSPTSLEKNPFLESVCHDMHIIDVASSPHDWKSTRLPSQDSAHAQASTCSPTVSQDQRKTARQDPHQSFAPSEAHQNPQLHESSSANLFRYDSKSL